MLIQFPSIIDTNNSDEIFKNLRENLKKNYFNLFLRA